MEPATLTAASLGAVALAEGIKFLYQQAGDAIKWWVSRKRDTAGAESGDPEIALELPDAFDARSIRVRPNRAALERLEPQLRDYRRDLADVAEGLDDARADAATLARVETLRALLETVYQTHLTFKGESRPASGTTLTGKIDVDEVAGKATAVRLRLDALPAGSQVTGEAKAKRVEAGGELTGIDTMT